MKTICLIGGKLQGFEVTYLAKKAGYRTVLIDRDKDALIKNFVDEFYCFDIIENYEKLIDISKYADAIIPLNENLSTINFLKSKNHELSCPLLFDFNAFYLSRDKKRSKEFFRKVGIPTPLDKPLDPPFFVKPACESSSIGTAIIYDIRELDRLGNDMIIEEYVPGDVISLEVIGDGLNFAVGRETKVHIDSTNDCNMITPHKNHPYFRDITYDLAKNLRLKGIMDVEAIINEDGLKIIEIDSRFPSQTPIVVFHSSGINLLELLFQAFTENVTEIKQAPETSYCILEHLMDKNGQIVSIGEQLLSHGSNYNEYYVNKGIEIFECRGKGKMFTLITWGHDVSEAENNRTEGIEIIEKRCKSLQEMKNGTSNT